MERLTILGVSVAISVLAIGLVVVLQARAEAWQRACEASDNLVVALEQDIRRNFSVYDLSLQGAAEVLDEPGLDQLTPALRRAAIFDRAASAEDLGAMLILNAAGNIIASSKTDYPLQADLTDRDYFAVHRDRSDIGLYVSRPFRSRMRNNKRTLVLSRRLTDRDGSFQGIVFGALNVAYFDHLFERLNVGERGVVTLTRTDGHIVARFPSDKDAFDLDVSSAETFQRSIAVGNGHYVGKATVDGVTRLYTFQHIGELPLVLSVGLAVSEINAEWLAHSIATGGMLGLLCLLSLVLIVLFRQEVRRRIDAEEALARRAETLAVEAATDGLTGLSNRPTFDKALTRSWRQAARAGGPLALLLLDADCFKFYNDQYGHQAGDEVLRNIAACLAATTQRPLDVAARYGGEEFAVLLPDTTIEGALSVAESIRRMVAGLQITHGGSPSGVVTVSLGVAATEPVGQEGELLLIQQADQALYESKRRGRNRVTASPMMAAIVDYTQKPDIPATIAA